MKWKFKLLFLTSTILIVVSAFVLNWTTFHAGKRAGLKEGEIYVVDGTEIYVAPEKDYLVLESEATSGSIEIAAEADAGIEVRDETRTSGEDLMIYGPEREEGIKISECTMASVLDFYSGTLTTTAIVIDGEGDEEVCVLDWSTGKLEFRGKMSSSARSFFKYFLKPYVDEYITEELGKKGEISILSCKEAIELRQEFPISYYFKDMLWPMSQSLSIERFIEWLYFNDCKIIKKRK